MLEIKNPLLKKNGETFLVPKMSFSVVPGEMFCISGHHAVGKTLLLKVLLGMQRLDGGFVTLDGDIIDGKSANDFRYMMSYIPQDVTLPYKNIAEMIEDVYSLDVNGEHQLSREQIFEEWRHLGIEREDWTTEMSQLQPSTIQLAMLSVARLLKRPYVLMDEIEPLQSAEMVADYLRKMASEGVAIILVSNNPILKHACVKSLNFDEIQENINLI